MLLRCGLIMGFTFNLLGIPWSKALLNLIKRAGFSVAFGGVVWCVDHLLRVLHFNSELRLGVVAVFCVVALSLCIWFAGSVVFGHHAVRFILDYAAVIPECYAKQLRMQLKAESITNNA